jgi:hypothetical protein
VEESASPHRGEAGFCAKRESRERGVRAITLSRLASTMLADLSLKGEVKMVAFQPLRLGRFIHIERS